MKKLFLFALSALCLTSLKAQDKIMVIADPHVLPQSVINQEANFDAYMNTQRKMIDLSEPIWHALVDTALAHQPSLVLIPGDLTRDGEQAAHDTVSAALNRLQQAGIRTLVIPGNHDLPGDNWETLYPGTFENALKEPNTHSFAVSPLDGITVIGIDGSNGNAGTGVLSEATLSWVLHQADSARAKGHMIIGMTHWQILEHFDQQGTLESACRFKNADELRDSLMAHGVHLVLTGHFHVNGITTYRNAQDSLVEITTGSPITFPCPYRWLTVSADRSEISVETEYITNLDTISDLFTYSRDWMAEHAQNMIPSLALRAWNKVENNWDKVEAALKKIHMAWMADDLHAALPQTNEAKIDLVQRHFGNAAINLYLFHSEANEFERPEMGQALADSIYNGVEGMIGEVFADYIELLPVFNVLAKNMVEEPVQSIVEDKTQWKSENPDCTDDLHPVLRLNDPYLAIESVSSEAETTTKRIKNGQLLIERNGKTYNAQGIELK